MSTEAVSTPRWAPRRAWNWRHLAALILGNVALALGPWWVRLADCGPVAAGFWRLTLALPMLALLAWRESRSGSAGRARIGWRQGLLIAGAGVFFGLDLAAWHLGIVQTRLGNATLFGNSGSLIVMGWGLVAARRWPRPMEWGALAASLGGAAILFGRSLEISHVSLHGDLLCVLAGLFYAGYILSLQSSRAHFGGWKLLVGASVAGAPVLLAVSLSAGEAILPHTWWPLLVLALSSQVIGQGLLVYALRHFSSLVIGLALLCQPAIGVSVGALVFGEALAPVDVLGMLLVAGALVLAKAGER